MTASQMVRDMQTLADELEPGKHELTREIMSRILEHYIPVGKINFSGDVNYLEVDWSVFEIIVTPYTRFI